MSNGSIVLDDLQRAVLQPQLQVFMAAASDDDAHSVYAELAAAVERLEVAAALAARLGGIIEVLINSGRVRKTHGPGAELALWSLYQKTPQGEALLASIAATNKALAPFLGGPALDFIGIMPRGPGVYALTLRTADLQLVLRFEPGGVRVESAEVGAG